MSQQNFTSFRIYKIWTGFILSIKNNQRDIKICVIYIYIYECIIISNIYECFKCPILKCNLESPKKFTGHRGQTTIIMYKSEMYCFIETIQQRYIELPLNVDWNTNWRLHCLPLQGTEYLEGQRVSIRQMNENDRRKEGKKRQEKKEEREEGGQK